MSIGTILGKIKQIILPSLFKDEEESRRAVALLSLLAIMLCFCIALIINSLLRREINAVVGLGFCGVLLFTGLLLIRHGHLTLPSHLIPFGLWVTIIYIAFYGYGIHDITMIGFAMIITVAGLFQGKAAAIVFSLLSILGTTFIYIGEINGWIPKAAAFQTITSLSDLFIIDLLIAIACIFIYAMLSNLSHSLERLRQNEKDLRELNDELERRVRERTTELEKVNERLTNLSQAKDEFIANISHELRTPITSIMLYHNIMESNPQSAKLYIDRLKRETSRLAHLIEDLLFLARLDQGRSSLTLEPVDLNQLVEQVTTDRSLLADAHQLHLTWEKEPDLPEIHADGKMLGQVLSVLLTNALSYTPAGGKVIVRTLTHRKKGKMWAGFTVSDSGPGIPREEQKRIFERFFRGKTGHESDISGTGLGLAIAKDIVVKHEGSIEIESTGVSGEGTTFFVWLPAD